MTAIFIAGIYIGILIPTRPKLDIKLNINIPIYIGIPTAP